MFSTHSRDLHCCLGSPEVLAGQEHRAEWSTTEQMAPDPQGLRPASEQGSMHLPLEQAEATGQSRLDEHSPLGLHPEV